MNAKTKKKLDTLVELLKDLENEKIIPIMEYLAARDDLPVDSWAGVFQMLKLGRDKEASLRLNPKNN